MVLILVAGIDTTWSAIGSAIWHLARHPEDLARLVNEPDLMPVAVEEFLRFYAPVTMARLVAEDYEFFGCPMKKDDWILLGFPAANRDPEAFDDADKFIIDRAVESTRRLRSRHPPLRRLEPRATGTARRDRGVHRALPEVRTGRWRRRHVGARVRSAVRVTSRFAYCLGAYSPRFGPARASRVRPSTPRSSSGSRGRAAERFREPVAVTSTSSSMRTPMPRYSSGTVRSLAWK